MLHICICRTARHSKVFQSMSSLWQVHRFQQRVCFDNTKRISLSVGMVAGSYFLDLFRTFNDDLSNLDITLKRLMPLDFVMLLIVCWLFWLSNDPSPSHPTCRLWHLPWRNPVLCIWILIYTSPMPSRKHFIPLIHLLSRKFSWVSIVRQSAWQALTIPFRHSLYITRLPDSFQFLLSPNCPLLLALHLIHSHSPCPFGKALQIQHLHEYGRSSSAPETSSNPTTS